MPPNYDSLLGKLIVWADDRDQCINRCMRALDEMTIAGVPTTIDFHKVKMVSLQTTCVWKGPFARGARSAMPLLQNILDNEYFRAGDVDTGFIVKHADALNTPPPSKESIVAKKHKKKTAAKVPAGRIGLRKWMNAVRLRHRGGQ